MIRTNTSFDTEEVFGAGGHIARSFPGFEPRPQQVRMADEIQKALFKGRRLAIEAGTGVGKSFAYLVPAIEKVHTSGGKVLVSTYTITLQEQLINKDLPFLADCLEHHFTAVLAKGRGNYVCMRRLEFAVNRVKGLFDQFGAELDEVRRWAELTKDGSLSDLGFVPSGRGWDAVKSEHGNCRGRKCPFYQDCFYWRARRRLETADLIVANHALMFSDLALKEEGASVLPDYNYVIIDEAHNIEHVAEDHFGIDISDWRVKFLLDGLYNSRTHKGLLTYAHADKAIEIAAEAAAEARAFFRDVRNWYEENKRQANGRCHKNFIEDRISGYFNDLASELTRLAKGNVDENEKFEFTRYSDRCRALVEDLGSFLGQSRDDYVYWVEPGSKGRVLARLKSAAINVGADVKRCLFDVYESVILTSATLSSDGANEKKGFEFLAGRVGLEDFDAVKLGSPFDYEKQVTMYIEKGLPNPNEPDFVECAAEVLKKYILQTQGRAFLLFTSYAMLEEMSDKLSGWLGDNGIDLLEQGAGLDRGALLKQFKSGGKSVLFGTDSFWQGVDVPGEALSNVIILRLPFAVPNQPLLAGRLEQIRSKGGNPFFDYQLPSAIIKFKQGFGRLIRSKTDTGIVVVLDSRIVNKRYGARFLAAIPKCRTEIVSSS